MSQTGRTPLAPPAVIGTPLVDSAVRDPLSAPAGVADWLRGLESDTRRMEARVLEAAGVEPSLRIVMLASASLQRVLNDNERSGFHRALRRPLWQFKDGQPSRRSVQRYIELLLIDADVALRTHAVAQVLIAETNEIEQKYGASIPRSLRNLRAEARITSAHILNLTSPADAARARLRAKWMRDQLDVVLGCVPDGLPSTDDVDADGMPVSELRMLAKLRMRTREALVPGMSSRLGSVARRHRDALLAASGRPMSGRSHMAQALEAAIAVPGDERSDTPPAWQVLLTEARVHLDQSLRLPVWTPGQRPSHADVELPDGELTVMPIGHGLVAITVSSMPVIRLTHKSPQVGRRLGAVLRGSGAAVPAPLAAIDIGHLFDGFDSRVSSWWRTSKQATIRVIAKSGNEWYGEVVERGTVCRTRTAVSGGEGGPNELRILTYAGARSDSAADVARDAAKAESERYVLGFRSVPVRTDLYDVPNAVLRVAHPPTAARVYALEREAALFADLSTVSTGAPVPLGSAELPDGVRGILYRMPTQPAIGLAQSIKDTTVRVRSLQSLAAIVLDLHRLGWTAGLFHVDVLEMSLQQRGKVSPAFVLMQAPLATRHGEAIVSSVPMAASQRLIFSRLCMRGIPAPIEGHETATRNVDASCFAVFALEMMATAPLVTDRTLSLPEMVLEVLRQAKDKFTDPALASRLAEGLGQADHPALWKFVEAMSVPPS